jgi:hypothetical protein
MRKRLPARMVEDIFNPFKRANLLADIPARCAIEYKESPERTLVQTFRLLLIFSPATIFVAKRKCTNVKGLSGD